MNIRRPVIIVVLLLIAAGCQSPPRPIFPAVSPPIVWPPPPDRPRIRYVGELRGEASLGVKPRGWQAFREIVTGPRPLVEFSHPSAVAVAGERVFVADTGLGVVHLLDLAQRRYKCIQGSPSDPLLVPIDVIIMPDETVAVVDRGRSAIDLLDRDGQWRSTLRADGLEAPTGAAWDARQGQFWVVDAAAHACFAWRQGEVVRRLGQRGSGPGQFNFPSAVTWHPLAGLVVADAMNFRVQVIDDAGREGEAPTEPRVIFGRKGDAAGDFARPRSVAVDSDGHIYVLDNQFENVQIFNGEGRLLMAFGRGGQGPGEFSLPSGITIDQQDRIWIADSYNRRVQVFQYLPEDG
ncbi:MAG: 6-bladed beta-propeller [Phycisphaerae bacterium]|nr:6-bladed beta-propeller [Phycisphaerae bacterium]